MASFATFERDLKVATAGLEPAAINAAVAKFAREEIARVVASGEGSPNFDRYVNGRAGAAEESVQAPGPILYVFNWWADIITAALEELVKRSPRKSGRYARSFLVVVGGRTVVTDFTKLRGDAEVIIFNPQPYTRRIETGSMSLSVPARHFETARGALRRRFGNSYRVEMKFVEVPSGISTMAPYRLRTGERAGAMLTYPALVMNAL
ncbi:hypothetical protein [Mesorhizobium sp. B2-6-1]|uniref:hypothetical protein n=1 Tax=Mesorhizobium sp. B2-6-1 TaxID=2589916 RepID=UPI00112C79E7|nr:hypothetical protein [Mesorhizobium sp. B2-6-1]TPJ60826.1 hypothetical protein FJ443_20000 [Mesorhizobium sp. B2-6-1]